MVQRSANFLQVLIAFFIVGLATGELFNVAKVLFLTKNGASEWTGFKILINWGGERLEKFVKILMSWCNDHTHYP